MHELSLAASLIETAVNSLKDRKIKKILEVEIDLGDLSFITDDQMRHAFEIAASGTQAEGAKLLISRQKGRVSCMGCGYLGEAEFQGEVEDHHNVPLQCPKCNRVGVEILEGKDIILKNVRAEVD